MFKVDRRISASVALRAYFSMRGCEAKTSVSSIDISLNASASIELFRNKR
jgi:hypothetical protein